MGRHQGAFFYTPGQRASLGGVRGAESGPWFVLEKDVVANTLLVGQGRDHPLLNRPEMWADELSFINPPSSSFDCEVQIRHLGEAIPAHVSIVSGRAHILLSRPHFAAARGQYAVFYQGDVCLGGGQIV